MSNCFKCGTEFTLKEGELKCDTCGEITNFPCHSCKQWFSVYDEHTKKKRKECKVCYYFVCPNCNWCAPNCDKIKWKDEISSFFEDPKNYSETIMKILDYIEKIKSEKPITYCEKGVPKSYAKGRNKMCLVRMKGFRNKNNVDTEKFNKRIEEILDLDIGKILTINQTREAGSYGQEYRDVFNLCICLGHLEKLKIQRLIDGDEKEFEAYKRVENGDCNFLDAKDLILKSCPNSKCKIKIFPLSQKFCCDPRCNYKKGDKKGQQRKLKLKISNKDICKLNRGLFKKEEDAKSKYY